jgi:hypothetical protein
MSFRYRLAFTAVVMGGLAVAGVSCDKSPTRPSASVDGSPGVRLAAPAEIAPGETVQLRATIRRPDGSVEDITGKGQWHSAGADVVNVTSTGLASGRNNGEAFVTVRFEAQNATGLPRAALASRLPTVVSGTAGRIRSD